ncbi:hypothetical protein QOT17_000467 [Balamuthia mandrillaris]
MAEEGTNDGQRNLVPHHQQQQQQLAPPILAEMRNINVRLDTNEWVRKLELTERERDSYKKEVERLEAEKQELLKKHNKDMQKLIKSYEDKINQFEALIKARDETIQRLGSELEDTKKRLRKIETENRRNYEKLLLGQIKYTFIQSAVEYIWAGEKSTVIKKLRHKLTDMELIEEYASEHDRKAQYDDFVVGYEEGDSEVLGELACARTLLPDGEEEPTPRQLQEIISKHYEQRKKSEFRKRAVLLVDKLDTAQAAQAIVGVSEQKGTCPSRHKISA